MANEDAPEGSVWVCTACGKMARDKYGFKPISWGWDESCMLNADLFSLEELELNEAGDRVVSIKSVSGASRATLSTGFRGNQESLW